MTAATALLLANKDLTVGLVSYNFYWGRTGSKKVFQFDKSDVVDSEKK